MMKEGAHIRAYKPGDKEAVLCLLRLNTPVYFAAEEEKDLVHYLDNEIEQYFVVEIGNEVVGCGGINFAEDGTSGKISWDILHPDFQGKGLGTLLLKHRLDILKTSKGVKKITVRTSQVAYRFYERSGFKVTEQVKDYWAEGFDLYNMVYKEC
ncbi:MAG: GNAT family N-acetyltransferase [Bacteroidota bacterium]